MSSTPNSTKRRFLITAGLGGLLLASLACNFSIDMPAFETIPVGTLRTQEQSIANENVDRLNAQIDFGAGELSLRGGADALLEAEFTYNVDAWEPSVEFDTLEGTGNLIIKQGGQNEGIPDGEAQNTWNLALGNGPNIDLVVNAGAGEIDLDLDELQLNSTTVNAGAGSLQLDLGNSSPEQMTVSTGVGESRLDFRGPWQNDAAITINAGVGTVVIDLPSDVGVQVTVEQGLGGITADGLTQSNNRYRNEAYGQANINLDIIVRGGIGEITLRTAQ